MHYQFDGGARGQCRAEIQTAGRHGFASPKIFRIARLGTLPAQVVTFRFTDKLVAGVHAGAITNATLCRIAIAQYLLSTARVHAGATVDLDTAIPPFDGPVLNARGVVLTVSRLHSPRGMGRTRCNGGAEIQAAPRPATRGSSANTSSMTR
ncbi:MAG: hypothetical protein JWR40_170 [Massilia sp.]|nr:hypothetical protein [Massilia sp.]